MVPETELGATQLGLRQIGQVAVRIKLPCWVRYWLLPICNFRLPIEPGSCCRVEIGGNRQLAMSKNLCGYGPRAESPRSQRLLRRAEPNHNWCAAMFI